MKIAPTVILLLALLSVTFSWKAVSDKIEQIRDKGEGIKERLNLDNLGLSSLKDMSLKDLADFKHPDLSSKLDKLKHIIVKDLDPSHHKDIDVFWTGFFEAFKLPKPTDLIDCFGTVSGPMFFRKMRTANDVMQYSLEDSNPKLQYAYGHLQLLLHALEHTHKCMLESQDFQNLAKKLDISTDPEELMQAKRLFYQAKYAEVADDWKGFVEKLDNKEFEQAGKDFGNYFDKVVKTFKQTGTDLLQFQAYFNGMARTLKIEVPIDNVKCYDAKGAKAVMNVARGNANAVTEGKWYKADESATEFWKKEGQAFKENIPSKVWECDMNSEFAKKSNEKLGSDVNSEEFIGKLWAYIKNHNIMYYGYSRTMKLAFDKGDYLHAGATWAHVLQAVAKQS